MKKRILSLLLIALMALPLVACFKPEPQDKYDYNMSDYITLPSDYKQHTIDLELDSMQAAIDTYLIEAVREVSEQYEYKVSRGDDIYVDITVFVV